VRLTIWWQEEAAVLAAVIGETAGAADDDVIPAVVGRTLVWTHRTIFRAALTGLLASEVGRPGCIETDPTSAAPT
jgi:hypothetical protein